MTHGFITIATGDEQYYKMAVNLLHSYRHFSENPLPFAILAERENAYTAEFDDVRLFSQAHRSYLDKLQMFEYLPYDVNIFIDADCLAYGDLNSLFEVFQNADDFSCFGRVLPLGDKTGWFEYENLGELKPQVSYVVGLHGGIYCMRRTELCRRVMETAQKLVPQYSQYRFKGNFSTPGDEPLIALSMALQGCRPIPHDLTRILCYWEHQGQMRLDMSKGLALAKDAGVRTTLLHWGTRFTRMPLYRKQIADLHVLARGSSGAGFFKNRVAYCSAELHDRIVRLAQRAWNKALRMVHLK